eukprot:6213453-Pleurochrysis_carterae.AAC.4
MQTRRHEETETRKPTDTRTRGDGGKATGKGHLPSNACTNADAHTNAHMAAHTPLSARPSTLQTGVHRCTHPRPDAHTYMWWDWLIHISILVMERRRGMSA